MMLHESRGPYSANFSQDEIENFYNPPEIRIGGERINGQSSDLSIIIEFRDGKPVLKNYTNKIGECGTLCKRQCTAKKKGATISFPTSIPECSGGRENCCHGDEHTDCQCLSYPG